MNKKDRKNIHDKKNLLKLLPAAAVIAAVTVTAVQGKSAEGLTKVSAGMEIKDAGELSGLLNAAYFDDNTLSDKSTTTAAKNKKKKKGVSKKLLQKHYRMNRKRQQKVREVRQLRRQRFRKADIKMELIREAVLQVARNCHGTGDCCGRQDHRDRHS